MDEDVDEVDDGSTFSEVPSAKVEPFPRDRYLKFISALKVQSRDYGLMPFRLLGSQRYTLDQVCEGLKAGVTTFVILKSRQIGMTTFWLSVDKFWAFEYPGLLGTFVLHKEEARDEWRTAIEVFYHEIPKTHKIRMIHHNRNILSFANGSRFRYVIAGTAENRKGGMGRSSASNYVHATECAFYGREEDLKAFKSSISSLYPHRLQIYESTANGFNHFYDTWTQAKSSPAMRAIFVGWWRNELFAFAPDDPRYEVFIKDPLSPLERQRIRAVRREYAFDISKEQLAWYRWKREDEFGSDQSMMDQEFPWTENDAFQATGSQYFTTDSLGEAIRYAKVQPYKRYRYKFTRDWKETSVVGAPKDPRAELRIWEDASKFGYYSLGCDPAYGSSDEADRHVISVWRGYADRLVQVAEWCSQLDSTYQTAWVLAHLAGFYGLNESRVCLEINGPGKAVLQELKLVQQQLRELKPSDEDYALRNVLQNIRHYYYKKADSLGGGDLVYHYATTSQLKPGLMGRFKDSLELGRLVIRSVPLCEEMRRIVNDEGHISAEGAHKDDRVMAAALAHENWQKWQWKRLREMGMTQARSIGVERAGGVQPLDKLMLNYLRKVQIEVPGLNS